MLKINNIKLKKYKIPLLLTFISISGIFLYQYFTFIPEYSTATTIETPIMGDLVPDARTLSQISTMQEMTAGICERSAALESKVLTDTRSGSSYQVTKLKDNNCWMTQDMGTQVSGEYLYYNGINANTACSGMNSWQLPSRYQYATLLAGVSATNIRYAPYSFNFGGYVEGNSTPNYSGTRGYYWTSTQGGGTAIYALLFDTSYINTAYTFDRSFKCLVRCVARTDIPDIQIPSIKTPSPTLSVTVPNIIALDVSDSVDIATESDRVNTGNFTATVSSNKDYTISLNAVAEGVDATSLVNYKDGDKVGEIPTITENTQPQPGISSWGIMLCNNTNKESCTNNYLPLPTKNPNPDTINPFVTGTKGTHQHLFQIGIGIGSELPSGTYATSIQVTASQK